MRYGLFEVMLAAAPSPMFGEAWGAVRRYARKRPARASRLRDSQAGRKSYKGGSRSCGSPAAALGLPQQLLVVAEAAGVARVPEDPVAVFVDRLRLARQADGERRQPPDQGRQRAIREAELRIEEELGRLEHRHRLQQLLAQALAGRLGLGLGAMLDLGRERIPLALDARRAEPDAGSRERVHGHQRGVRIALVEVFADDVDVVQHEVAIDQRRQALRGVELGEVLGLAPRVD